MSHPTSVEAPAKLILLGEHFVVFGARALAVPLAELTTRVTLRRIDAPGAHLGELCWSPLSDPHPRHLDASQRGQARRLLERAIERIACDAPDGFLLDAYSVIPPGYGLGSSAAFAVALVRAMHAVLGRPAEDDALRRHAHALERLVHGTPSGIDDAVAARRAPLTLRRGQSPEPLAIAAELPLVLASCGVAGSTREAVARVAARRRDDSARFDELLREATTISEQGVAACASGDLPALGLLFDRAHTLLVELGVSASPLDELVAAARGAGALGAKLTGAGLGGFVVALARPDEQEAVSAALQRAGGTLGFCTTIRPNSGAAR